MLICAAVATMTSIGMSTFSLFLPPIERELGYRALATPRQLRGFMVVMGIILLASGLAIFGGIKNDENLPEPVGATNPDLARSRREIDVKYGGSQ